MKIIAVIPTFNEAGNIASLVSELFELNIRGFHILIVDDASTDGTDLIIDRLAAESKGRLAALHRKGQRGLGLSYIDGFKWALENGADVIVQMDADFSHQPTDVPRLIKALKHGDVVVGSRYVSGSGIAKGWGMARESLSRTANVFARTILSLKKVKDLTSGFKVWRRSALESIDLSRVKSNGFVFQVEMAYLSELVGLTVIETPIFFADRKVGESKMNLKVKIDGTIGVFSIWWRYRRLRKSQSK